MVSVGLSFPTMIKQMVPSFKLGQFMMGFNKNQLIKPSYFELKNYKTYQVGNLKFNIVDGYIFSFDTPLPAISPQFIQEDLDAGIFPQQISQDIKDGFVWKKITPKQKENIENICSQISKMDNSLKTTVIYKIKEMVANDKIESVSVIKTLENKFKVELI